MDPALELVQMLSSQDYFEGQRAAWALVEMGESALEVLFEALESSKNSKVRYKSVWVMGKIRDNRAVKPLGQALLTDPDEAVREWSASSLEAIGNVDAVPFLVEAMRFDSVQSVQLRASKALWMLGAAETLMELLDDPDIQVRRMAINGLGRLKCEEAIEKVASHLKDDDAEVRRRVAWFFGQIGAYEGLDHLKPALQDANPEIRTTALKSLVNIGSQRSCELALTLLCDEHPEVRLTAVTTLGEIGSTMALDSLTKVMLGEDHEEIRAWAAWSLGEIGDESAMEALREAHLTGPPEVQEKARASLKEVFQRDV
jgi:HEAT repeat protein